MTHITLHITLIEGKPKAEKLCISKSENEISKSLTLLGISLNRGHRFCD